MSKSPYFKSEQTDLSEGVEEDNRQPLVNKLSFVKEAAAVRQSKP